MSPGAAPTPPFADGDFAAMLDASSLCVLVHDADSKQILWANPAACELLEFTLEELLPLTATGMSSAAARYDRVLGRAWLQEAVELGRSRIEWHYRSKSGRVIPTDALAVRVELTRGPVVLVQFRDIERELATERDLRRTVSFMDGLAHRTSTLALMLDRDGVVHVATDAARSALGAADDDVANLLADVTFRVDGAVAGWDDVVARARPVAAAQLETWRAENGAQERAAWFEGSVERLDDEAEEGTDDPGDGAAFLMILHDVSARVADDRRRERELLREHHLARYSAMGDLAMSLAHELGQPLAAAANFLAGVETAAAGDDVGGRDRVALGVAHARRQIERASSVLSSLRSFVGARDQELLVADLREVVEECRYFAELRGRSNGVRFEIDLPPEPVTVTCARVLTGQVVLNYCFNAIEACASIDPAHRVVRITVAAVEDEGRVTVDDRGGGLRGVDPFAEPFTTKVGGSGIGLQLSRRIIERQDGTVWADELPGIGTRFGFALPLDRSGTERVGSAG